MQNLNIIRKMIALMEIKIIRRVLKVSKNKVRSLQLLYKLQEF
jgi:hypothetical protein